MDNPPSCSSKETDPDPEDVSDNEIEPVIRQKKPLNMSPGAVKIRSWLNKTLRIEMSDGRVLVGVFLCTDRDCNIILGSCSEYLPDEEVLCVAQTSTATEEPRMLGLVMVPGKHILSICIDRNEAPDFMGQALTPEGSSTEDVM